MNNVMASSNIDLEDDKGEISEESIQSIQLSRKRRYTNFIVSYPFVVIGVSLTAGILCLILWQTAVNREMSDGGGVFSAINELEVRRSWALQQMEEREDKTPVPERSQTTRSYGLSVFMQHVSGPGNNLFTPEGILQMYETLQQVRGVDPIGYSYPRAYQVNGFDNYCQLGYNDTATPPKSKGCLPASSLIDDIIFHDRNYTRDDVLALSQDQINTALEIYTTPFWLGRGYDFYFATDFAANQSFITRAKIHFGVPLPPATYYAIDNEEGQDENHENWVTQYTEFFYVPDPPLLRVNYYQRWLSWAEVVKLIDNDFAIVGAAGVSVFFIIGIRTQSVYIAITAMINILMAYPIAMFIYHGIFQILVDTRMNSLALFIILGIGADDTFVFFDAWQQSAKVDAIKHNLYDRMYWTWSRAAGAMAVTSFTTFFAFIMTAVSPIPAVSVFGIVSSLLVLGNYLLVISFFPACFVVWNMRLEHMKCCLCIKTKVDKNGEPTTVKSSRVRPEVVSETESSELGMRTQKDVDVSEYRRSDRFFYQKVAPFLNKFKWYLFAFGCCWFILVAVASSFLEPPDEETGFIPEDTEMRKALDTQDTWFAGSAGAEFSLEVSFVWGINPAYPLDRSGLDQNDDSTWGKLILDTNFNFNNATQMYLQNACERIRVAEKQGVQLVNKGNIRCFMKDLRQWEQQQYTITARSSPSFYDEATVASRLLLFVQHIDNEGNQPYSEYARDFGIAEGGTRVKWVRMNAETPLKLFFSRSSGDFYMDGYQALMDQLNLDAPPTTTAQHGMQASQAWESHVSREKLVGATILSVSLAYMVAVIALIVSSQNFIVAAFASVSIASVVMTLLAFFVVGGWGLGTMQSIIATLLVGLSVDYCVHVAHSYTAMLTDGRYYRARSALLEIGTSVSGGLITSLTSSFFLFWTVIPFFQLFGKFIFITIIFSYFMTFSFFVPSMMLFGPNKKPYGDVAYTLNLLWAKIKGSNAIQGTTAQSKTKLAN